MNFLDEFFGGIFWEKFFGRIFFGEVFLSRNEQEIDGFVKK